MEERFCLVPRTPLLLLAMPHVAEGDDLYNKIMLLDEVRIGCCILFDNGLAHFVEESAVDT